MIQEIFTQVKVPCFYHIEDGSTIEHCKKCSFFNGIAEKDGEIIGVDCIRNEIPVLRGHITGFSLGEYQYNARNYDEKIDGPIEGNDPYDYCQKCCFDKTLQNGKAVCLLRSGVPSDVVQLFCCYEGEIWTKEKIDIDDDDID